jgi:hypothetical protein
VGTATVDLVVDSPLAGSSWTLAVDRSDLARTRRLTAPLPDLTPGEALLRVERVGLTANNVTYAVLGEAFRYWEFFPTEPGWGVVPLWGFAEVVDSTVEGLEAGARVYGYLPSAGHLLVRPGRVDARGFRETSEHRATLPSPYNTYARTSGDPAYEPGREDLQVLFRPLFWTSFMLADWLIDNDAVGAQRILLSSASSKTAYGAAFELHRQGREVVALTSPRNVAFTQGLGCYDAVLPYDGLDQLSPDVPTLYADLAGDPALTAELRTRLGTALVHEVVVGVTHQEAASAGTLADTGPAMFFAPDQMRKRIGEWGREGLDLRFAEAWRSFAPVAEQWVDVVVSHGPDALEQIWREVLAGRADPRAGHVIAL